jgi:hypothetical protein
MIPSEDYYVEDGLVVMTAAYHIKRGCCCGNGCRWCPYEPKHQAGATTLSPDSEICAGGGDDGSDTVKS